MTIAMTGLVCALVAIGLCTVALGAAYQRKHRNEHKPIIKIKM